MRKKDRTEEAHDFSGLPAPKVLTPADVQAKEFGVSRFGGYRMRDVDEFLDELTASMTRLAEENERLSSGAIVGPPPIGAPDVADAARQADQIIERARAEAARIVQGAEDQVAIAAAAGPTGAADRAAVAAFLAREREFLQSLAGLVQGHAETIKGMAKASRPTKAAGATEPAPGSAATPAAAPEVPPTTEPETAGEPRAEPRPDDRGATTAAEREEPIRVEEPAPAAVSRSEGDDEQDTAKPEGDPSLRELFWGEE
jgi:DivIVA domain-containing protein